MLASSRLFGIEIVAVMFRKYCLMALTALTSTVVQSEVTLYDGYYIPQYVTPHPNYETLEFYLKRNIYDIDGFETYKVTPASNPKRLESDLYSNSYLQAQMDTTGLLSYLFWSDGQIVFDEKSKRDRFGLWFDDETLYPSQSVGKSIMSYILGHAICEGYIDGVDVKVDDWPLIKNTVYDNQSLINLLNMKARDHELVHDAKGILSSGRWYNVHPLRSFMDNELANTKPASGNWNDKYNYNGLVTRILINYVIFKVGEDYQSFLERIFKNKVGIENELHILKSSRRGSSDAKKIPEIDGVSRYTVFASRYDYLRIGLAMLEDWESGSCVGNYLKELQRRKISKNMKPHLNEHFEGGALYYGGQFHMGHVGMEGRNVFLMSGYGGQGIMIDFDMRRVVVINTIHTNYDHVDLVYNAIKTGELKGKTSYGKRPEVVPPGARRERPKIFRGVFESSKDGCSDPAFAKLMGEMC